MDDAAEVVRCFAVGGLSGFGVVLDEDLGAVALALGYEADVEAGIEQLGGRELPQRQDRAVERVASSLGC